MGLICLWTSVKTKLTITDKNSESFSSNGSNINIPAFSLRLKWNWFICICNNVTATPNLPQTQLQSPFSSVFFFLLWPFLLIPLSTNYYCDENYHSYFTISNILILIHSNTLFRVTIIKVRYLFLSNLFHRLFSLILEMGLESKTWDSRCR